MKKAVLAVSFGTSHTDTLEKTIAVIERELAGAMPDYTLCRAFTSGMIIKKLRERDAVAVDDVPSALQKLIDEGFSEVVIQPTHIINGDEYEKLTRQAEPFCERFDAFSIGAPLLTSREDFFAVAKALIAQLVDAKPDEAVLFMGHGSRHHANSAYAMLESVLRELGCSRVFIGTVEGYPELDSVLKRIECDTAIRSIRLLPLMVVAGDHAKNDMAGDDEDSWKSQLESRGYAVTCEVRGLGELPEVRQIFIEHAKRAAEV